MDDRYYEKKYVEFYDLIIDITKLIKDFLYPGKYSFERLNKKDNLDEQLLFIKNDLESLKFTKEVLPIFIESLQHYFPTDNLDEDRCIHQLEQYLIPRTQAIKESLINKYLSFIRLAEINLFSKNNRSTYLSDDEIWENLLSVSKQRENVKERIEDVIWQVIDEEEEEELEDHFKKVYDLDDIQFARLINGENNEHSSIVKTISEEEGVLNVNFKSFNKYFDDIFGQDEAIETIRKTLLRNVLFYNAKDLYNDKNKKKSQGPLATFMFYGPTGTGKTETAKRMADFVYNDESKLLILDMNTFKDSKISSSSLKGHPEGYVDSSKGTDFTRFLSKNGKGVIVLDEFEKAPSEVRELFMTMLDEGTFKDALGNTYDLSGYIFIATTNVSKVFENRKRKIGFGSGDEKETIKVEEDRIKEELRNIFTAPIMNRFNNVVNFKPIKKEDAILIGKDLLEKLIDKFESKKFGRVNPHIKVYNINDVVEIILEESNFKKDGVRSVKNVINDLVASPILEEIVDGKDKIVVSAENGKICVTSKRDDGIEVKSIR